MKCSRCGLDLALCDHPVFEYIKDFRNKDRKEWSHECCLRGKEPCATLETYVMLLKGGKREQDP